MFVFHETFNVFFFMLLWPGHSENQRMQKLDHSRKGYRNQIPWPVRRPARPRVPPTVQAPVTHLIAQIAVFAGPDARVSMTARENAHAARYPAGSTASDAARMSWGAGMPARR